MKKSLLTILLLFTATCSVADNTNRKTVNFSTGSSGEVYIEEETAGVERVMVVDYRNDSPVRKEDVIEKQVAEIWKAVTGEADRRGFATVIIKYRFPAENADPADSDEYTGLLFEAERIENGTWKLRRVN